MGRGDKKSAKGKISKGSHGKTRPKKKNKDSAKKAAGTRAESGTSR